MVFFYNHCYYYYIFFVKMSFARYCTAKQQSSKYFKEPLQDYGQSHNFQISNVMWTIERHLRKFTTSDILKPPLFQDNIITRP